MLYGIAVVVHRADQLDIAVVVYDEPTMLSKRPASARRAGEES